MNGQCYSNSYLSFKIKKCTVIPKITSRQPGPPDDQSDRNLPSYFLGPPVNNRRHWNENDEVVNVQMCKHVWALVALCCTANLCLYVLCLVLYILIGKHN